MRVAIIGRTEILYDTGLMLLEEGYEIACIVTAKAAPEYTRTEFDFQKLANKLNIPYLQTGKIAAYSEFLSQSKADIAVSVNYTDILSQSIIDLFPYGVLNAHGGDLPRYRGNACQAWAILNGEDRVGLCIHKMVGGLVDSGDIIAREYLDITLETKVTHVWGWMIERIPYLFVNSIKELQKNSNFILEHQSSDASKVLRCYPRMAEDGFIDWRKSSIDILRLINASNKPYSGAFCRLKGERLIVWDAELVKDDEVFCAIPGQIIFVGNGYVDVACGGMTKIRLLSVELGDKVTTPDALIKSIRTRLL